VNKKDTAKILGFLLLGIVIFNSFQDAQKGEDEFFDLLLESYGFWGSLAVIGIGYS
jgi:hypothetical protein